MSGVSSGDNEGENAEASQGIRVVSSDEEDGDGGPEVDIPPIAALGTESSEVAEPMEMEVEAEHDRQSVCSDDSDATEICPETENNNHKLEQLDDDLLDIDDPPVQVRAVEVKERSVCPGILDIPQTAATATTIENFNNHDELPNVDDPMPLRAEWKEKLLVQYIRRPGSGETSSTEINNFSEESFGLDDTVISVRTDEDEGYERAGVPIVNVSTDDDQEIELLSLSSDTDDDDEFDRRLQIINETRRKRERSSDSDESDFSRSPSTSSMALNSMNTNFVSSSSSSSKKPKPSTSCIDLEWESLTNSENLPNTSKRPVNYPGIATGPTNYQPRGFESLPVSFHSHSRYRNSDLFNEARVQSSRNRYARGRGRGRARPIRQTTSQRRRNIRQIFISSELRADTRKAEKDEINRLRRVGERQKLYKNIFPTSKTHDGSLVLDFDAKSKEMVIGIESCIVKHLKIHQEEGIKFMYSNCFESVDVIKKNKEKEIAGGGGCILAHCMGLGKTFQTVAFTHAVLSHQEITGIRTVLIVCPLSTVTNWYKEYQIWLSEIDVEKRPILHRLWKPAKCLGDRVTAFKTWKEKGGVGFIHYDLFRNLVEPRRKKKKKGAEDNEESETKKKKDTKRTLIDDIHRKSIEEYLLDPGADLIICDEGHLLKNSDTQLSKALNRVTTLRRVALTGTPLQNNLVEYHTMMQFVKPHLLGDIKEFKNRFANPIRNGECKDSNPIDVLMMKRRAHVLHKKLEGCVQRLDHTVLKPYLQPKHEYCIFVRLTEKQKQLYRGYLDTEVTRENSTLLAAKDKGLRLKLFFLHYSNLVKILAHPKILMWKSAEEDDNESIDLNIAEEDEETETTKGDNDDGEVTQSKKSRASRSKKPINDMHPWRYHWWSAYFQNESEMEDPNISGKLVALQEIIKISESIGDKILVFSQWLTTLDIIEDLLQKWDDEALAEIENGETEHPPRRWRMGREFFRIDGSVKTADRQLFCDAFNSTRPANKSKLFLISTKAGGLGINLHGANRVVMFDASFNPSNDMQSVFRVYRLGQVKPCYIYRLVGQGSIEEKVYNRQVVKLALASRVVDEHQIERHFRLEDLDELYKFEPDEDYDRPEPPLPKDELLSRLLTTQRDLVHSYLEHDSLLVNIVEEELTIEQQRAAEEEFSEAYDVDSKPNLGNNLNTNIPATNPAAANDTNAPSPGDAANDANTPSPSAANVTNTPSPDGAANDTNTPSPGDAANDTNASSPGDAANDTNTPSPSATNVTNTPSPRATSGTTTPSPGGAANVTNTPSPRATSGTTTPSPSAASDTSAAPSYFTGQNSSSIQNATKDKKQENATRSNSSETRISTPDPNFFDTFKKQFLKNVWSSKEEKK